VKSDIVASVNRRRFLLQGAALASVLAAETGKAKSDRIGISSWSFHNFFTKTHDKESGPLDKSWDLREFPAMIADRYGVHQMEMVAPHFESMQPSYIAEVKASLARAHSHLVNIPVDIEELQAGSGLSDPNIKLREGIIAACVKWIDLGQQLGAKSVRCDPGKINRADLSPTISAYKKLASYAGLKDMYVIIENHGGVGSEHPEDLVKIFQAAGPHCGALPDMGNFPDEATRKRGLRLLYPYARTVSHAKGLKFDAAGKETAFDFPDAIQASKDAGYNGVFSIEYEGPGDPYVGVQHVVDELNRYL
jgi:sugar phosphate isomerase/epimerase